MNGGKVKDDKNRPMTGTGTVTIKILDVNDNVPILEKTYVSVFLYSFAFIYNLSFVT